MFYNIFLNILNEDIFFSFINNRNPILKSTSPSRQILVRPALLDRNTAQDRRMWRLLVVAAKALRGSPLGVK